MATWKLPATVATWIGQWANVLHRSHAWRLEPLLVGMLLATGRKTVASWLRAGELGDDFQGYYYLLGSLGRKTKAIAAHLLRQAIDVIQPGERLLFALDDTPTKRYGPHVQGAGIHHNPTPGPAHQKYVYGHVWVTLAWVVQHACWGAIGLPLLALLYVRRKDVAGVPRRYGVCFQTKLEQAADLVTWLAERLRFLGKTLWIVADGAYAKKPFLLKAIAAGATVVSRLRKDAALYSVPAVVPPGRRQRGRPRKYGADKLSLAKRAGHKRGWTTTTLRLYGDDVRLKYKTFLATYRPAGGLIRVVLVRYEDAKEWRAYLCTDPQASVADVLTAVADRAAIEQVFHDVKEVHGAGQQQVRNYWANVAAYHVTLWMHTLIELWAWNQSQGQLVQRQASPWDEAERRPSHADRRKALRRQCLQEAFAAAGLAARSSTKIRALVASLVRLAA